MHIVSPQGVAGNVFQPFFQPAETGRWNDRITEGPAFRQNIAIKKKKKPSSIEKGWLVKGLIGPKSARLITSLC
jgi:hypothetical protein